MKAIVKKVNLPVPPLPATHSARPRWEKWDGEKALRRMDPPKVREEKVQEAEKKRRKRIGEEQKRKMREMRRAGRAYTEISKATGLSENSVRSWCLKNKVYTGQRITVEEVNKIKKMYWDGKTLNQIIDATGKSKKQIKSIILHHCKQRIREDENGEDRSNGGAEKAGD